MAGKLAKTLKKKESRQKKAKPGLRFMYAMGAAAGIVSLVEVLLIFGGYLPPVFSYSPSNLLFVLARYALVAYTAAAYARQDLKISAITGAFVGFAGAFVTTMSSSLNYLYIHKAVLGVLVWSRQEMFVLMMSTILQNMAIGAIVGAAAGFLFLKFSKN